MLALRRVLPLYLLVLCQLLHASELFSPRNVTIDGFNSTSISLSWRGSLRPIPPEDSDGLTDPDPGETHFKLYFWWNGSAPTHLTTPHYNITLTGLRPGALYSIWLIGMHGNMTSDYVTLYQRTGRQCMMILLFFQMSLFIINFRNRMNGFLILWFNYALCYSKLLS